jgi:hypothetical protein
MWVVALFFKVGSTGFIIIFVDARKGAVRSHQRPEAARIFTPSAPCSAIRYQQPLGSQPSQDARNPGEAIKRTDGAAFFHSGTLNATELDLAMARARPAMISSSYTDEPSIDSAMIAAAILSSDISPST